VSNRFHCKRPKPTVERTLALRAGGVHDCLGVEASTFQNP